MAHKKRFTMRTRPLMAVLTIAVIASAGVATRQFSSAATINPYGFADSCALINGATVIYGWGADANAGKLIDPPVTVAIGGKSARVSTGFNYRNAQINAFIDQNHPGDPKPGTYGYRVTLTGLYKGTTYGITGTIHNVGAGVDKPMQIRKSGPIDGDASKPYFANSIVPDACLAPRPAPPAPTPGPAPAPTPAPAPAPAPRSSITPRSSASPGTPAAPAAGAVLSSASDAVVSAGTLSAGLVIPAGNAAKIRLLYGTSPVLLDQTSEDITTDGKDSTHLLTGLRDRTTYTYAIVRTDAAGTSVSSPTASFTTTGFDLAVYFTNTKTRGVAGITAQLNNGKARSSDKEGKIVFSDLAGGEYTLAFTYNGTKHKQTIRADSSKVSSGVDNGQTVILSNFINVDKLSAAGAQPKSPSKLPLFLIPLAALVAFLAAWVVIRRRKRRTADYTYGGVSDDGMDYGPAWDETASPASDETIPDTQQPPDGSELGPPATPADTPAVALPEPVAESATSLPEPVDQSPALPNPAQPDPVQPDNGPQPNTKKAKKRAAAIIPKPLPHQPYAPESEPEAQHIGESLKTMVLRSMREEAQRRQADQHDSDQPKSPHRP